MSKSQNPVISIIMPIFNGEAYLEESIGSALSQSLENIELICIDDGSTDGTAQILRNIQQEDQRLKVISQDNLGAGPARNAGLREARGSYVAFLDSDDLYPSDTCLEEILGLALIHDAKIAGGSLMFLDKDKVTKAVTRDADFTFPATKMVKYRDFQQAYYYQRFIFSRDMLEERKIYFPEYRRS